MISLTTLELQNLTVWKLWVKKRLLPIIMNIITAEPRQFVFMDNTCNILRLHLYSVTVYPNCSMSCHLVSYILSKTVNIPI